MDISSRHSQLDQIFPGDSELARRMRDFDWLSTSLGPPQNWPENLRTAVNIYTCFVISVTREVM